MAKLLVVLIDLDLVQWSTALAHRDFRGLDWLDAELDNIRVSVDPTVAIATTTWGGIKTLLR